MTTTKRHWMEDAERVTDGDYIGEDDYGDLWVMSANPYVRKWLPDNCWERFNRWRPDHLLTYWRSRRHGRVVWLEADRG